ncbi:2-oxoglutarate dehydrogenase complex dihydrolipoyllysine-residue succinyltransferase [Wolbachia endosymbiont of Dipetalonema caudispina]|uniref:2-oxoglutarate dehydrogenase complex dihydrolipoyllysine-residue succinyltransferase n=1 Tax=Wolbachia endosymbiont of Dipetalonema caudispina TaxID=1812112 RepID=UPI00158DA8F8|nr:2-oxoglutarate dehydrogenase complex dihydrolipoyllysine-residue succinyltransferase [Wolbachia endosymbiont of Dipetalonema caudispina]QKX00856.1 2-oxoglutarate dehydrogenase complex dihydrolipoyllysine-residue succinyltransferase [Wolbachia endosymbiont of Dipetalonema caudispina]
MSKVIEIRAPEILGGESVTEGIVKIKRNIGESIKVDDLIFEIETDKAALELTAEASGQITEFCVKENDVISPGQLLARLSIREIKEDESGEDELGEVHVRKNSPSARKIMKENSISAESIKGTGMGGRITKADLSYIDKIEQSSIYEELPKRVIRERREERVKMSKIRQVIAARLKASQNTAAILTTFNEIDMQNVMNLRAKYKEAFEKKYGIKLGFMSFFIKAAVQALREVPEINAEISGEEIIYKYYYDIGVAIGADKGLVVPVIRSADQISFAEIELALATLSKKARESKLQVSEMEGATFTISNGGVYGSLLSTPIINPPQSGILGMHSIQNRPVVVGNSIEIRPIMYIALSYDHKIVDGKGAITFLVKIKNCIEDPSRLLLEV